MINFSLRERLALSRRRFITGAAGLCGAGVVLPRGPARALSAPHTDIPLTSSARFSLAVERVPVVAGGRRMTGTGINGSLPAPTLRWREGDTVEIAVTNRLDETTSLHWHGIRLPADMDGVPGLSFAGIRSGATFTYRFPVRQSGTYWYHSHSGMQEQTGLYGALVIDPAGGTERAVDRDYVLVLSDWTDADPEQIVSSLKFQSDYYNFRQRTVGTFVRDAVRDGPGLAVRDRLRWGAMNMAPTDISDVSGVIYTYLMNGQPPETGWTGLFRPGERVRLRVINAASMTLFDVRIPGLTMHVVGADGQDVEPVPVDEFRIGPAETYDVIVQPEGEGPWTIFVQSEDRTGYARGTLATRPGQLGPVPPMDPRPLRTMVDMGMGGMDRGPAGHDRMESGAAMQGDMAGMDMAGDGMRHAARRGAPEAMRMPGMAAHPAPVTQSGAGERLKEGVEVQSIAMMPRNRLTEPGAGLEGNGRRCLTYADLRATRAGEDARPPSREITLHLTGNMERFIWGFDGKKFSEAEPVRLVLGERVRFILINDTMMEHPIHLHGFWSELENGQGAFRPYKHTITVKPGERLSSLVTVDTPGLWAYHCHLLYHMEVGMFRTVVVS
ncbi:copper resistance system multicopper oxidase [Acetobacter fallax]|uniref:Copper resistance system multicopper oxidase n=1 Tax=Acetobacter fallax TaxID=1737473 RepID=A0ABX0KB37_9PROT|nr:copper resistance system multicopper oxidase [Acetobacter fallax]NHO33619.1 copper resistance system multicopper oxidase [Acetobacter fallax]NHO37206.1 copper resistance system multicopper oxidase [Acetobacter fallax]